MVQPVFTMHEPSGININKVNFVMITTAPFVPRSVVYAPPLRQTLGPFRHPSYAMYRASKRVNAKMPSYNEYRTKEIESKEMKMGVVLPPDHSFAGTS